MTNGAKKCNETSKLRGNDKQHLGNHIPCDYRRTGAVSVSACVIKNAREKNARKFWCEFFSKISLSRKWQVVSEVHLEPHDSSGQGSGTTSFYVVLGVVGHQSAAC